MIETQQIPFFSQCSYLLLPLQDNCFMKLKRIKIQTCRSDWSEKGGRISKCMSTTFKIFLLPPVQQRFLCQWQMKDRGKGKSLREVQVKGQKIIIIVTLNSLWTSASELSTAVKTAENQVIIHNSWWKRECSSPSPSTHHTLFMPLKCVLK